MAESRTTDRSSSSVCMNAPIAVSSEAAFVEKISSIGDDLSKSKPELNKAVKIVFESAKRNK